MYDKPRFLLAGDKGLFVEFGGSIDSEINRKVWQIFFSLEKKPIDGVTEIISTYRSILIFYNPFQSNTESLKKEILDRENRLDEWKIPAPEIRGIDGSSLTVSDRLSKGKGIGKVGQVKPGDLIRLRQEDLQEAHHIFMIEQTVDLFHNATTL